MNLSTRILIAMGLGLVCGWIINSLGTSMPWLETWLTAGLFRFVGDVFVAALQLLVVPLVLVSLVCGVSALSEPAKLGRLGSKAIGLYLLTTMLAVSFALAAGLLFSPGANTELAVADYTPSVAPPALEVLINMVPRNPFQALAEGNMLQVIVFAVLLGLSVMLAGPAGERVSRGFQDWNEVVMALVTLVMKFAPYGVFALIARLVAEVGIDKITPLIGYFALVLGALIVHLLVTYPLMLKLLTGLSPFRFLAKMRTAQLFAFSTASSNATIPVTLRTVRQGLGVNNSVSSFTVPLGATLNMDGTAIMQGIATIFIAQVYGVDLTMAQLLTVILMATLASIGSAGVPGAGLILLATVLVQVGLPVEAIAMIIGIDRLLDMARTAVNITGDAMVSVVVARSEGALDESVFNDPMAGIERVPELQAHQSDSPVLESGERPG